MTPSARLQATLEVLDLIEKMPRPADALISGYFRARRYIGSKDRGEISRLAYAVMRHRARLDWWMEKVKANQGTRERLLAYKTLVDREKAENLEEAFSGKKYAPSPLSDEERNILQRLKGHTLEHPDMPEAVAVECPPWAEKGLRQRFGKHFACSMRALLEPAPLDLRVNTVKVSRVCVLEELAKLGIEAEACRLSPWGIRIGERLALEKLPMLRDGRAEIQDEGSQLVAMLVDAKPGQRVVDFCAGAGGKTLAIAAQMENKGRIVACDVLEKRLKRSTERFRRAGPHNIEVKPLASERDPWVKKHKESFDRVLVDAPCSGTGTWRRNPDQRWRFLGPGLDALAALQAEILESAARLVKPGGRLIYATCSLLAAENEEQIDNFLLRNGKFEVLPVKETGCMCDKSLDGPYLRLAPYPDMTDGFFAAIMVKKI